MQPQRHLVQSGRSLVQPGWSLLRPERSLVSSCVCKIASLFRLDDGCTLVPLKENGHVKNQE